MTEDLIDIPPATDDALQRAAERVLGPTASEALLADGAKLFRGGSSGLFFLQGPGEGAGELVTAAARDLQDQLMVEDAKLRAAQAEEERAKRFTPGTNPFIKVT